MHEHGAGRDLISAMVRNGDHMGLLRQAEMLHGHLCPMVALGVKAGHHAMNYLNRANTGMEEVVAVVETNNCFSDGIQLVTGCTFGNSALIFYDLGKTAVTVARRDDGAGVRLAVRPDFRERLFDRYPAAGPLFEKVMVRREGDPEDHHRFRHLWEAIARRELEVPLEEQLLIKPCTLLLPELSRILDTVVCQACGEGVMASRVLLKDGKPFCLACAGGAYGRLTGMGIEAVPAG